MERKTRVLNGKSPERIELKKVRGPKGREGRGHETREGGDKWTQEVKQRGKNSETATGEETEEGWNDARVCNLRRGGWGG